MSEDNNINLPADFDNLSKHAPLLAKIRLQGDGFVVPSTYFDEIAEKIISLISIPAAENSFPVPGNYFEALTNEIIAVTQLANLKTEAFGVPETYFNELEETINTKLALDNLKQDEGFDVPENYFEKLTEQITLRAQSDFSIENQKSGIENSFPDVPSGYFDTLADKISARIAEEEGIEPKETIERGRIIVFAEVLKRFARPVSIAASVALILAVSIWFFNRSENPEKDQFVKTNPKKFIPVVPQVKDTTTIPNENIVVQPEIKKKPEVNLPDKIIVKETDQQIDDRDIIEHLYLLDENIVADYLTDENVETISPSPEGSLNDEMLNYLIDHDADPSGIHK
jgi:hypothetical protein